MGKYLTYAFVAIGLVRGATAACSAWPGRVLRPRRLRDGDVPQARGVRSAAPHQSTPGIPDFMDWNQLTALPTWWKPFTPAVLDPRGARRPTALAFVIGFAMFKRRVGGVYFAIITQAWR
jgi:urea transport system permease protein